MRYTLLLLTTLLLASCSHNPGPACEQSPSLPPITPDYCNVVMPCSMALPGFMVADATHIRAEVEWDGGNAILDGENEICLDKIYSSTGLPGDLKGSVSVFVSVWSPEHPDGIRYAPFTITLSPDTINRYLTYRLIPPGYEGWYAMGIYQRDLTTYEETAIVTTSEPSDGCVNCHTPSWGNANRRLYHKRGEGGGTQFYIDGKESFLNLKDLGLQGSYPAWHPDGRYIAFASTDTHQSFYHRSKDKIEVYDLIGKLFIYDTQTQRQIVDERFNDSTLWHTFPTFSPDGRTLYYCRARAVDLPHRLDSLQYELVACSFDAATATLGDEKVVVDNAGHTRSVSFPRVSPDGRFLMYTVADCGTFPIWHKEADLAMLDLASGQNVDISSVNSNDVESFHNWSTNSRWVVFSSRRVDGRYTRLFFAHVDEDGCMSKPFMLPQQSPLHDLMLMDSYNIPELMQ